MLGIFYFTSNLFYLKKSLHVQYTGIMTDSIASNVTVITPEFPRGVFHLLWIKGLASSKDKKVMLAKG